MDIHVFRGDDLITKTGFPSLHYFSRLFREYESVSPKEFRNKEEE